MTRIKNAAAPVTNDRTRLKSSILPPLWMDIGGERLQRETASRVLDSIAYLIDELE